MKKNFVLKTIILLFIFLSFWIKGQNSQAGERDSTYTYLTESIVQSAVLEIGKTLPVAISSGVVGNEALKDGQYVLDLSTAEHSGNQCRPTKILGPAFDILSKANDVICESKRNNLLEFCSCVTSCSAKKLGEYSPMSAAEIKKYKVMLEDLSLVQASKQALSTLVGVAATVEMAATDTNVWHEVISTKENLRECSAKFMPDFMEEIMKGCKPEGVKRMKLALDKFNVDIFPDHGQSPKANFEKIFSERLVRRIQHVHKDFDKNEENEIPEIKEGNEIIFKILKENKKKSTFTADENETLCSYLFSQPFISHEVIRDFYNKGKRTEKTGPVKNDKPFMNCNNAESAKALVAKHFENVMASIELERKKLYPNEKKLDDKQFQEIMRSYYRVSSADLLKRCHAAKTDIMSACTVAGANSFSPALIGLNINASTVQKVASDALQLPKEDFPSPRPTDLRFRAQMDQLMCFTHGDAKGLFSEEAIEYAKTQHTFTKHEDIVGSDEGESWESSKDTEELDKKSEIANANKSSGTAIERDYKEHAALYDNNYGNLDATKNAAGKSKEDGPKYDSVSASVADNRSSNSRETSPGDSNYGSGNLGSTTINPNTLITPAGTVATEAKEIIKAAEARIEKVQNEKSVLNNKTDNQKDSDYLNKLNEQIKALQDIIAKQQEALNKKAAASVPSPGAGVANGGSSLAGSTPSGSFPPAASVRAANNTGTVIPASTAAQANRNTNGYTTNTLPTGDNFNLDPKFYINPTTAAPKLHRYATFKEVKGNDISEVVVDLSSLDVLVISEYQFRDATPEQLANWYEKTDGGPIYIMDHLGSYKRAVVDLNKIPADLREQGKVNVSKFGKDIYRCLDDSGKDFVECSSLDSKKVERQELQQKRPVTGKEEKVETGKLSRAKHRELVRLLQKQTAGSIIP